MKQFVTSDYHLGHQNIIKYCNRPFKTVDEMNETIIRNHNQRVKEGDTVHHLGDFCFRNSPGGKRGEGLNTRAHEYRKLLTGELVFVKGNHDKNNSLKTIIDKIIVNYGGHRICMVHNPAHIDYEYEYNFCGHVHEKWKFNKFEKDGKITWVVNVGVDQWGFMPITIEEALKELKRWRRSGESSATPINLNVPKQNERSNSESG